MWDWFVNFMTQVLASIQGFCGDWGLAVIILTVIIRILLVPLMNKQTASMARMQVAQPKIQEIQEKYADDPTRQSEEMQKVYSDLKFNPVAGCLPIFLQMPIFFALFTVAKNVPADASFYSILPSITASVSDMVASSGWIGALSYILFDVAFGVLTFIPMMMNTMNQSEEQKNQSLMMGAVIAVMMLWFGWSVPSAVLLYYDASAIWQVAQQKLITQRVIDKAKEEGERRMSGQPVEVDVIRKDKKPRPHKKG